MTEVYTIFFFDAELIVFDNAFYFLSLSLSSSEIFAVKLENFCKMYQILHVFCCPKF